MKPDTKYEIVFRARRSPTGRGWIYTVTEYSKEAALAVAYTIKDVLERQKLGTVTRSDYQWLDQKGATEIASYVGTFEISTTQID